MFEYDFHKVLESYDQIELDGCQLQPPQKFLTVGR